MKIKPVEELSRQFMSRAVGAHMYRMSPVARKELTTQQSEAHFSRAMDLQTELMTRRGPKGKER